jgi:hypothetical protein
MLYPTELWAVMNACDGDTLDWERILAKFVTLRPHRGSQERDIPLYCGGLPGDGNETNTYPQ